MKKSAKAVIIDILLIAMMILPLTACIVLKILFSPAAEGITVTGAIIYFTIPMPIMDLPITESQVNSWAVILTILAICLFLTRRLNIKSVSKRQFLAELIVEKAENLVKSNMGERFMGFAPFIAAILGLSALSSLSSLLGLYPPTSDINIVAGWAILVFILITHYKLKGGLGNYLKGYTEPIAVFTPINIISEVATPVSMTFRHFGNVLSGSVISVLVAAALQGLTSLLLGWLPGLLGEIPFLQIGIPAVLSLYFDIFSGCLQAFIFAMLTMLYIANGFPEEAYEKRRLKKRRA
ncbi:MAG: F0F1 ATP synthase subunit A [Candidatus Pseudoruminococcus sp.]|uniref:F0F1 ATP synthase subunit A n=1 Tax=Candidatus Pseudoruminococcus sp. TaxID=3101048 RepID=UPI002A7E498F|nr:F0F1 ATP synthase subunit A [Candidatus Pseudoruminococcus sp.]